MTIADLIPGVVQELGNRTDVTSMAPADIGATIIELSDNYPFEELRVTGPTVQFTPGQNAYPPSYFQETATETNPYTLNKVISWFFYLSTPVNLFNGNPTGVANSGYGLRFKDIEDLEVLTNTLSLPTYWSWLGADLYVAATPQQAYYTYMRYQWKHPITAPFALATDAVYLPQTWFDVIQIASAKRIALKLRMQDVADRMHVQLFGDPKNPGDLGLIARRVSQTSKNQSRTSRTIQLARSKY